MFLLSVVLEVKRHIHRIHHQPGSRSSTGMPDSRASAASMPDDGLWEVRSGRRQLESVTTYVLAQISGLSAAGLRIGGATLWNGQIKLREPVFNARFNNL
jgi:hypothetical protein